jgi:DnaK suppressor protein
LTDVRIPVCAAGERGTGRDAATPTDEDRGMLTEDQRNQIEKLLLRERDQVVASIRQFDATENDLREQAGELSLYRFHMADIGTETMEREKEFLFASRDGRRLWEVDEALRRLYREPERFGVCERCEQPIGFERLEVIPEARLCAQCQQTLETEGAETAGA